MQAEGISLRSRECLQLHEAVPAGFVAEARMQRPCNDVTFPKLDGLQPRRSCSFPAASFSSWPQRSPCSFPERQLDRQARSVKKAFVRKQVLLSFFKVIRKIFTLLVLYINNNVYITLHLACLNLVLFGLIVTDVLRNEPFLL